MNNALEQYFTITDREARAEILNGIRENKEIDQEELRVLEYLWKIRYDKKIGKIIMKDAFLDSLMQLLTINGMLKSGLGWKHLQKQVLQISEILGLEDYRFQTEKGAELFVREYENLARYFFELGQNDRSYGRGALNLGVLEEEKYYKKIQKDFDIITDKIPQEFGFSIIFAPLKKGMNMFMKENRICIYAESR